MAIIKIRNAAIDLDAAEIPNLPATKITSGTLDNARISLDAAEIPNLDTAKITTGTLADARVPNLNASKITAGTIATARLGSGTANSSTFLRGDNTFAEAGGGITVADQWRLTASKSTTTSISDISANLEQIDTAGQGTLGSAMTESSGVFTFPSTGIYLVMSNATYKNVSNNNANYVEISHLVTTNNSSFVTTAHGYGYFNSLSGTLYNTVTAMDMIDVTDTSNVKIKFGAVSQQNAALEGASTDTYTSFTFIRLGDT